MGKSKDAFRTISEVADWLDTQAHVLRFWESKFTQVKPVKRAGGRRYYRPADMRLLGGIKKLLHDDGMTIKGAQKLLREKGVKHVSALSPPLDDEVDDAVTTTEVQPPDTPEVVTQQPEPSQVLEFASRDKPPAPDTDDVEDMPGDLFPVAASDEGSPEPEEAPETPEDLPGQDELPAFLQRVTFDPVPEETDAEDEAPAPEEESVKEEPVEEPLAEAPEIVEDVPETASASPEDSQTDTQSATAPDTDPPRMEPSVSLLTDLAASKGIAAGNRAEARALAEKLAALHARIAESENA